MIEGDTLRERVRSALKFHAAKRDAMRDGYRVKSFALTVEQMRAHDRCEFDRWLNSELRMTGNDHRIHRLSSSHRTFHESAACVIDAVNGNAMKEVVDEAWRRYMRNGLDLGNELSAWLREVS